MNESFLSTDMFVCLCARNYRLIFGIKLVPKWLTTLCLCRDPLRYDYRLPRLRSLASWKWNHTCSLTDRSLPCSPPSQGLASEKGRLWREKHGAQKGSKQARGGRHMRDRYSSSVGVWTPVSLIKACHTSDPAATVLWQHWDSMPCRTVSLSLSLSLCQQHRLSLNLSHFKAPKITDSCSKTWNVKLRTSTKNPGAYPALSPFK